MASERPDGFGGLIPAFDRLEAAAFAPVSGSEERQRCPDLLEADIDDRTLAYVLAAREPFDLLREATSQFAGVMVLAAAGARNDAEGSMLEQVRRRNSDARALLGSHSAPAPPGAAHHLHHLSRACEALDAALAAAGRGVLRGNEAAIDLVIGSLHAAYRHLQWATGALPGFEIVALSQGCCTAHGGPIPAGNRNGGKTSDGRRTPNGPIFDLGS